MVWVTATVGDGPHVPTQEPTDSAAALGGIHPAAACGLGKQGMGSLPLNIGVPGVKACAAGAPLGCLPWIIHPEFGQSRH